MKKTLKPPVVLLAVVPEDDDYVESGVKIEHMDLALMAAALSSLKDYKDLTPEGRRLRRACVVLLKRVVDARHLLERKLVEYHRTLVLGVTVRDSSMHETMRLTEQRRRELGG